MFSGRVGVQEDVTSLLCLECRTDRSDFPHWVLSRLLRPPRTATSESAPQKGWVQGAKGGAGPEREGRSLLPVRPPTVTTSAGPRALAASAGEEGGGPPPTPPRSPVGPLRRRAGPLTFFARAGEARA